MCEHQRINSTSFVFSAALPALLATAATETIDTFIRYPEMFTALQENTRAVRVVLGGIDSLEILSHPISPIVHLAIKYLGGSRLSPDLEPPHVTSKGSSAASILTRDPPSFDVVKDEALLQDVVDEALLQGVLITRAKRLYGDGDEKQVSSSSHYTQDYLLLTYPVASRPRVASYPTNYPPSR
jgi:serine palmitoyltransferase